MENNELDMDLFGPDSEIELDFTSEIPEVQADLENIDNPDAVKAGESQTETKLSDDPTKGQEEVAKEGEDTEGGKSENSSPNLYNSLAAHLNEQGLLSSTDISKIEDVDGLVEAFKQDVKEAEYSNLNENQLSYLKALEDGVPLEDYKTFQENTLNLSNITEEQVEGSVELRQYIIQQDYINQGLSEAKALQLTKRSIDNGTDVEDATEGLESIKTYEQTQFEAKREEAKQATITAQKTVDSEKKALKEAIMQPETIFGDHKVTDNFKETVYKDMTTVVNYHEGKPENRYMQYKRENPVEADAKMYMLFNLTNGFSNLNRFKEAGATSAVTDLERAIKGADFAPTGGQPGFVEDPDSYEGFGDELILDE